MHSAEHSTVNLNLNVSERVIYRGYSGCTIDRIAVRGLREVDSLKPTLVCLQIGSNDLCNLDIQVEVWVDKIVSFALELRGHGVRRVCVYQILHRKPPSKAGRFMVDSEWCNNRADLANKLLMDRLGRNFQLGIKFWRHSGFRLSENKSRVYYEDGVHLNFTQGYQKYYNSVRASFVSALKSL